MQPRILVWLLLKICSIRAPILWTILIALAFTVGAGCTSDAELATLRSYHDPSLGWTAAIPARWASSEVPGGQFVRDLPMTDPTRLVLWTYRKRSVDDVLRELTTVGGIVDLASVGERSTPTLRWIRYHGGTRSNSDLAVDIAVATEDVNTHLIALVARQEEVDRLVDTVLLPAIDSFIAGPPDPPTSVLAYAPPEPDYWPTHGWRTASPQSQGVDAARLDALIEFIRQKRLPIDSVTVVRHGYVVLDKSFPPNNASDLHELHSVTKSVTSALLGIALREASQARAGVPSVATPVLELLSPWHPVHVDERKRVMTLEHLLTMTAGLAWKEWDTAYEPGTGNNLVAMVQAGPHWIQYILDRPMADDPGATFVYNSGASYLLSAVVSQLTGRSAADLAAERLFAPLGITEYGWPSSPEGLTMGWGGLQLRPTDLARIGQLYLHRGAWDGQQIVSTAWVEASTTDQVLDPAYEYGYQWWLDVADGYAYMSGRFGQMVIVAPEKDMVIVITASLPDTVGGAVSVPRWLAEAFVLPAAH